MNVGIKMFLAVASILLSAAAADFVEEAGVLILTEANFDEAIKTYKHILVDFYAPWCSDCQALAPKYIQAAVQLERLKYPVKLGKVDATVEEKLAKKYGVESYPTLKFFDWAKSSDYTGGRTSEDIVSWILKRTSTDTPVGPVHILSSTESVESFRISHGRTLVAYCSDKNSNIVKMFKETASTVKGHSFGMVHDLAVINATGVGDNVIFMYKEKRIGMYDVHQVEYTGSKDPEQFKKFIASESFPTILEMNPETSQYLFDPEVEAHVLLFLSKENGDMETSGEQLMEVAKEIRERVLFVAIDIDVADHQKIVRAFGIKKRIGETPAVRIAKLGKNGDFVKYKPADQMVHYLRPDMVKSFVNDYLDGKLEGYLLSEDLPKKWDSEPVKVLVGSNFDDVTLDKTKDVLVNFYSPNCGYCHSLEPLYEKVAEVFENSYLHKVAEDVLIAKIDMTANELKHTKITQLPTIKLYKKGTNKVVEFKGNRTLKALVNFVESGGNSDGEIDSKSNNKDEL